MASCCMASSLSFGMFGKMTSCSTVILIVPSPYLQAWYVMLESVVGMQAIGQAVDVSMHTAGSMHIAFNEQKG